MTTPAPRPLHALVTAGGTSEPIDDVRVITNRSTGRFGAALANALCDAGVVVTLLASQALSERPAWLRPGVAVRPFLSYADLNAALDTALAAGVPDLVFMAAAVSDYSPVRASGKLRSDADELIIRMRKNPKILSSLRQRCGPRATLVGFKLLSSVSAEELVAVARRQVVGNDLDLCLANDLAELGGDQHPAWIVPASGEARRVVGSKVETATALAAAALARVQARVTLGL